MLKSIHKNIDKNAIKPTMDALREIGITSICSFIIGFPDETADQLRDTVELIDNTKANLTPIYHFTPLPGTELYDEMISQSRYKAVDSLEELAKVIETTNAVVLSDEIYAELTYGMKHTSIASIPSMKDRTILVSGFSKAYAMTGWRMGYLAAPAELARQMLKIHQYAIMCAPTTSQFAAIEALKNGDEDIAEMAAEYNRRRKFIISGLNCIGLDCFEAEGAFYAFPKLGDFGMTSEEFCEKLLYSKKVAIVPGSAFGACGEGFARISYAYSVKHISKALELMAEFIDELKSGKI
jgi:aminotransferase